MQHATTALFCFLAVASLPGCNDDEPEVHPHADGDFGGVIVPVGRDHGMSHGHLGNGTDVSIWNRRVVVECERKGVVIARGDALERHRAPPLCIGIELYHVVQREFVFGRAHINDGFVSPSEHAGIEEAIA